MNFHRDPLQKLVGSNPHLDDTVWAYLQLVQLGRPPICCEKRGDIGQTPHVLSKSTTGCQYHCPLLFMGRKMSLIHSPRQVQRLALRAQSTQRLARQRQKEAERVKRLGYCSGCHAVGFSNFDLFGSVCFSGNFDVVFPTKERVICVAEGGRAILVFESLAPLGKQRSLFKLSSSKELARTWRRDPSLGLQKCWAKLFGSHPPDWFFRTLDP